MSGMILSKSLCFSVFLAYFSAFFLFMHQMTPLHAAVKGHRFEIVKYLVGKEAKVNIKDHKGVNMYTKLHY